MPSEPEETPIDAEAEAALLREADETLWFCCCVANPLGYGSRHALYRRFFSHVMDGLNGNLVVVECAYGGREHALAPTDAEREAYGDRLLFVPARADDVLWHKENLLNLGIRELRAARPRATHVVWADADVEWLKGRAVLADFVRAFRAHDVVQGFDVCMDEGPDGRVVKLDLGYVHSARQGLDAGATPRDRTTWHTGYVWGASLEFLDRVGGLFDLAVLGSGDRLMADAFLGRHEAYEREGHGRGDFDAVVPWARRAHAELLRGRPMQALGKEEEIPPGLGHVAAAIRHGFHGLKKDRGYHTRGAILVRHAFDPRVDLASNAQGLHEWAPHRRGSPLADDVLAYFRSRNEDHRRV